MADLTKKLDDSVKVVSLQYASNVTGAWHPIDQVRSLIGSDRLFFVDATQAVLHGSIDMRSLGCDALVFSGHKIGADTGIGVLALTKTLQKSWQAPIGGGGAINVVTREGHEQAGIPEKWEPGTPHLTGAVTLTAALHRLSEIPASTKSQYHACIDRINTGFNSLADRIRVFHSHTDQALGIWSFLIPGKHSSDVADFFSERDICIRS